MISVLPWLIIRVIRLKGNVEARLLACRSDTWSLGVCNGCQLMALLGWVPGSESSANKRIADTQQPRFIHNESSRFESRWSLVTIKDSPAIMLKVGQPHDLSAIVLEMTGATW